MATTTTTTTTTSTTSAYQLEELRAGSSAVATGGPNYNVGTLRPTRAGLQEDNTTACIDSDPALEASRIADSEVPDGGYGWVVVFGCAVLAWWVIGVNYTWGVYQGALVEQGVGDALTISFCGSTATGIMAALATLNGRAMRSLGTRKLAIVGMTLNSLAHIGTGFAPRSLAALFLLRGVMTGVGFSSCFMALSIAPAQYFSRKRGLANGVVYAGGGFGAAVLSIATNAITENYGVEWAFWITGIATFLTGIPAAWLVKERTAIQASGFIDKDLLRNLNYAMVLIGSSLGMFMIMVPAFFIPMYGTAMGLSTATSAGVLAGFNFASAVGRIISGHMCDSLGALNTLVAIMIINSLTMIALWPTSTTLAPLAVFAVLNGLTNGGFFSSMPTVVGNVFGSTRVSTAMGMMITAWIGGYLMGSPIAGALLEAYGGAEGGLKAYRPAMFYAGSMSLVTTALILATRLRMNRKIFSKL